VIISSKWYKTQTQWQWKTNRQPYVAYPWRQSLWVTLWATFGVWNLSNSYNLGNIANSDYNLFTHESEVNMACNFNCHIETEGLLKVTGRGVTYTLKVVISQKRYKIEPLLLQTANSKWYMAVAYWIVPYPMTFSDLQRPLLLPSHPLPAPQIRSTILVLYKLVCMYVCNVIQLLQPFQLWFFTQLSSSWQDCNWHSTLHGPFRDS